MAKTLSEKRFYTRIHGQNSTQFQHELSTSTPVDIMFDLSCLPANARTYSAHSMHRVCVDMAVGGGRTSVVVLSIVIEWFQIFLDRRSLGRSLALT